jgi:hypothetical protein
MRFVSALALVLGLGLSVMASTASAQMVNQYGNTIMPQTPGGTCTMYVDGAVHPCTQPAPLTLPTPSGSSGVAGAPADIDAPYHIPFAGGDKN